MITNSNKSFYSSNHESKDCNLVDEVRMANLSHVLNKLNSLLPKVLAFIFVFAQKPKRISRS